MQNLKKTFVYLIGYDDKLRFYKIFDFEADFCWIAYVVFRLKIDS